MIMRIYESGRAALQGVLASVQESLRTNLGIGTTVADQRYGEPECGWEEWDRLTAAHAEQIREHRRQGDEWAVEHYAAAAPWAGITERSAADVEADIAAWRALPGNARAEVENSEWIRACNVYGIDPYPDQESYNPDDADAYRAAESLTAAAVAAAEQVETAGGETLYERLIREDAEQQARFREAAHAEAIEENSRRDVEVQDAVDVVNDGLADGTVEFDDRPDQQDVDDAYAGYLEWCDAQGVEPAYDRNDFASGDALEHIIDDEPDQTAEERAAIEYDARVEADERAANWEASDDGERAWLQQNGQDPTSRELEAYRGRDDGSWAEDPRNYPDYDPSTDTDDAEARDGELTDAERNARDDVIDDEMRAAWDDAADGAQLEVDTEVWQESDEPAARVADAQWRVDDAVAAGKSDAEVRALRDAVDWEARNAAVQEAVDIVNGAIDDAVVETYEATGDDADCPADADAY
jgi:hypothetical protein